MVGFIRPCIIKFIIIFTYSVFISLSALHIRIYNIPAIKILRRSIYRIRDKLERFIIFQYLGILFVLILTLIIEFIRIYGIVRSITVSHRAAEIGTDKMELDSGRNNGALILVLDDNIDTEMPCFEFNLAVLDIRIDLLDLLILDIDRLAAFCKFIRNINDLCFIFCNTVTFFRCYLDLEGLSRLPFVSVLIENLNVVSYDNLCTADFDFYFLCSNLNVCR